MSEQQLKSFLAKVKTDKVLQDRLNAAEGVEAVVAIALDAGYNIDADDLSRSSLVSEGLSGEDLESVAGGWPTVDYNTCDCTGLITCLIKICAG